MTVLSLPICNLDEEPYYLLPSGLLDFEEESHYYIPSKLLDSDEPLYPSGPLLMPGLRAQAPKFIPHLLRVNTFVPRVEAREFVPNC